MKTLMDMLMIMFTPLNTSPKPFRNSQPQDIVYLYLLAEIEQDVVGGDFRFLISVL